MNEWLQVHVVGVIRETVKSLPGSKRSPKWRKERNAFVKENPTCAVCGKKKGIQVHHIEPFHLKPWLELDWLNLISLCRVHHLLFGHLMWWKSWNVDVVKDAKHMLNKIRNRPYKGKA